MCQREQKERQSRRESEEVCVCVLRERGLTTSPPYVGGVEAEHRPRPLEVRRANPELNDLALYKIHDNYTDNYTKPLHGAHRSQLTWASHTHACLSIAVRTLIDMQSLPSPLHVEP